MEEDKWIRTYQLGWVDALDRLMELSHLSKEEIIDYCEKKREEIFNEL